MLLFFTVAIVSAFLGFYQYIHTKEILEHDFEIQREIIKNRVVSNVNDADHMYLLLEGQLEQESQIILQQVLAKYEEEKHINFELSPFIEGKSRVHLYIIDEYNKIIATTDKKEMGLDFNQWPEFIQFLNSIRQGQVFLSDRINLTVLEGNSKKFCYMPSEDGRYIFEVGIELYQFTNAIQSSGFEKIEERVLSENDFVDNVTLFTGSGYGYKKDSSNMPIQIKSDHKQYLEEAIEQMQTREVVGEYKEKKVMYQYIPYQIEGARGTNHTNVIEIIYNDLWLQESLRKSEKTIMIGVFIGALVSILFGFIQARNISKPIEKIMEATRQLSKGNFNVHTNIKSNDEFEVLSKSFDKMAKDIGILVKERYKREVELKQRKDEIIEQKEEINALYEETAAMNEELEHLLQENYKSYFTTVRVLANAIEAKDAYTGGHCERVLAYAVEIGNRLGLTEQELLELKFGSILHDMGKIGVPEEILNKIGKFTDEEYENMKKHPFIGYNILKEVNFFERSKNIVLQHHERIDGKGYPNGLKGEQIDILARIVCVADAHDAMTSGRPYRMETLSVEKSIEELIENKGKQFDASVVDVFVQYVHEFKISDLGTERKDETEHF